MAIETLPRRVTDGLQAYCSTIAPGTPFFVPSRPHPKLSRLAECFNNVAYKVDRFGGETVNGWAIWELPGVYFEAEHHGIWQRPDGKLLDVSPQYNGCKRILFLREDEAVYDPKKFRPVSGVGEKGSSA